MSTPPSAPGSAARAAMEAWAAALAAQAGGVVVDGGPSLRGFHYYELFVRCPRLWARTYLCADELGPLAEHSRPLVVGTLLHLGVAQWRARRIAEENPLTGFPLPGGGRAKLAELAKPIPAIRAYALAQWRRHATDPQAETWKTELAHAEGAVRAYVAAYAAAELYDYFAIEKQLTVKVGGGGWLPVDDPMLYTQRLDWGGIGRGDKKVYFSDVKGTARYTPAVQKRYTLSGQFLGYQRMGQQLYGDRFGGVLVDIIETRPPYRPRRYPLAPAPAALARYFKDYAWHERQRRELVALAIPPEDWPGRWSEFACVTPYGPCPAFEWCRLGHEAFAPEPLSAETAELLGEEG